MRMLALLVAASSARPAVSLAGDPSDLVAALGPFRAEPGSWVEYLVRSRGEQDVRIRFAIVAPPPDRARAWVEVATVGAHSIPFAARLLLHAATGKLERASVYALGQAPIEVPVADGEAPQAVRSSRSMVAGREKAVTVPAGTFTTTELRVSNGDRVSRVWRTDEVPLWGIVSARQRGRTMELLRFGRSGARSVFPAPQGNGSESANE
jgi:hypothetical protein